MMYDITVVGGGFGGLMTAAQSVRRAKRSLKIFWIDEQSRFARGTAYATAEAHHLLNVPAGRMSAWAETPNDFTRWLAPRYARYGAPDFAPRMIYGAYLESIRAEMASRSEIKTSSLAATAAKQDGESYVVTLSDGSSVRSKTLVLASGNPACRDPGWPDSDIYVSDFWRWRLKGKQLHTKEMKPDATIVIAGTGLTTVDAIMSLRADGFKGTIMAVSPHGWLPQPHAAAAAIDTAEWLDELREHSTAQEWLRIFREYLVTWPDEWRALIDAIRPYSTTLWQSLDETEKARFMRHILSLWNVHRHRMAPEIHKKLAADDRLEVIAGRITGAAPDGTVQISPRDQTAARSVKASKVINCTGPSYRALMPGNPLLKNMHAQTLLEAGPLGLGIATPRARGVFTLGTPLIGERLETTAVPELRQQATEIAEKIVGLI